MWEPVVGGVQSPDAFLSILRVPTPNQTAFNATLVFSTYIGGSNPPAQVQIDLRGSANLEEASAQRRRRGCEPHDLCGGREQTHREGFTRTRIRPPR